MIANTGTRPVTEWELRCQEGRVRAISVEGAQVGGALELSEPVSIDSPSGVISVGGTLYRDEVKIYSAGSFCEVVNELGLEKYLAGVVNLEFSSQWSPESVGAQVVAARTYALFQARLARADVDRHFDLDSSTQDQVYDGLKNEDERANQIVERTRGWVLTVGSAKSPAPVKAFYHSTCGGRTELPERVWGNSFAGFRRSVPCPYCQNSPAMNWRIDVGGKEVSSALLAAARNEGSMPSFAQSWPRDWISVVKKQKLLGLRVERLDPSGRVDEVSMSWMTDRGMPLVLKMSGARLRDWVGPARLRSTGFRIQSSGAGRWVLVGRGNGHGVGMCQWGAKTMGEKGFRLAAILRHYYPDAILRKLW